MELSKVETGFDITLMEKAESILSEAKEISQLREKLKTISELADSKSTKFYILNLSEAFMQQNPPL